MTMKAQVLISVLFASMPLTMMAQDDMYFTPSKQSKVQSKGGGFEYRGAYLLLG